MGQRFLVDVELDLAHEEAAVSDRIEDAVDYRQVVARVGRSPTRGRTGCSRPSPPRSRTRSPPSSPSPRARAGPQAGRRPRPAGGARRRPGRAAGLAPAAAGATPARTTASEQIATTGTRRIGGLYVLRTTSVSGRALSWGCGACLRRSRGEPRRTRGHVGTRRGAPRAAARNRDRRGVECSRDRPRRVPRSAAFPQRRRRGGHVPRAGGAPGRAPRRSSGSSAAPGRDRATARARSISTCCSWTT